MNGREFVEYFNTLSEEEKDGIVNVIFDTKQMVDQAIERAKDSFKDIPVALLIVNNCFAKEKDLIQQAVVDMFRDINDNYQMSCYDFYLERTTLWIMKETLKNYLHQKETTEEEAELMTEISESMDDVIKILEEHRRREQAYNDRQTKINDKLNDEFLRKHDFL